MATGFLHLCRTGGPAVIDWYNRLILSWRLSNTFLADFCVNALQEALTKWGKPEIFNIDPGSVPQGSQFTSHLSLNPLIGSDIKISMDSKGCAASADRLDNIFIERFRPVCRCGTIKYERSAVAASLLTGLLRRSGAA